MKLNRLGIGFIGSGFMTKFHLQSFVGVRDADILGVWSPNQSHAAETAALARKLNVGQAQPYKSIAAMVADPEIQALWISGPNFSRLENIEAIAHALNQGNGTLKAIACEKPLARNVREAKQIIELVKRAGLATGYLENQIFAPAIAAGREILWARGASLTGPPYLARAAEEHSGPHMPWFWQGKLQGGGVLNDMLCHSVMVVRHLLTKPGTPASSLKPVRVTARIASLKWSQPAYAKKLSRAMGQEVDYRKAPAEDFASATIEFENEQDRIVIGEASTSWSYVGPGLRLSAELLGPEYSMSWNSLDSGLKLFLSRAVNERGGEDLVEKQNAEAGQMPVIAGEVAAYGYEAENRHFVQAFLRGEKPALTFDDGLEIVKLLMTAYRSAEEGRTIEYPPKGLDEFVPAVARGKWKGK